MTFYCCSYYWNWRALTEIIRQQVEISEKEVFLPPASPTPSVHNCSVKLLVTGCCRSQQYKWVQEGIRQIHGGEVYWELLNMMVQMQPLAQEVPKLLIAGI